MGCSTSPACPLWEGDVQAVRENLSCSFGTCPFQHPLCTRSARLGLGALPGRRRSSRDDVGRAEGTAARQQAWMLPALRREEPPGTEHHQQTAALRDCKRAQRSQEKPSAPHASAAHHAPHLPPAGASSALPCQTLPAPPGHERAQSGSAIFGSQETLPHGAFAVLPHLSAPCRVPLTEQPGQTPAPALTHRLRRAGRRCVGPRCLSRKREMLNCCWGERRDLWTEAQRSAALHGEQNGQR